MSNFPTNIDNAKYQVYCFTNTINNKIYIGKTGNFKQRMLDHKLPKGDCPLFHNAIKKYGIDIFNITIIGEYDTEEDAIAAEIIFIAQYHSNNKQYGYNLTKGGDGVSGHKHSEESKTKISNSLKGKPSPNKGKKASDETKMKSSISHSGQPGYWKDKNLSEDHKQKLSASHKGQPSNMLGKQHTNETKQKLREISLYKFRGEKSTCAKLTINMAKEIKALYLSGNYTYNQLAEKFSVGRTTIWRTVNNMNYFDNKVDNNE